LEKLSLKQLIMYALKSYGGMREKQPTLCELVYRIILTIFFIVLISTLGAFLITCLITPYVVYFAGFDVISLPEESPMIFASLIIGWVIYALIIVILGHMFIDGEFDEFFKKLNYKCKIKINLTNWE
jgi:hypothetical protein